MSSKHLLGVLSVSILLATMVGCSGGSSPTPEVDYSPLASPIETPVVVHESTPSKCSNGCTDPSEDCLIKGVVTPMGERYYYLPDMESYKDAAPLVRYGGYWFCTEEEAIQNDFQKAPE